MNEFTQYLQNYLTKLLDQFTQSIFTIVIIVIKSVTVYKKSGFDKSWPLNPTFRKILQ